MNSSQATRRTDLISLPTEIQEAIFVQVEDIRTLKAIAASCQTFRNLVQHSHLVVRSVLTRTIPADILREAFAVHKSTHLPPPDHEIVQDFLHDHFASLNHHLSNSLTLNEAAALEEFHGYVQVFTADFVSRTLSINPITGLPAEREPAPVTESELRRIQRAFYRFELYCNLFRRTEERRRGSRIQQALVIPIKDQPKLFFHHFASWENEQLGCVHDFLLRVIDEPYDDVASHDVEWGEAEFPFHEGYEPGDINPFRRYLLSRGLKFIHRLSVTKDYESRYRLLDKIRSLCDFLDEGLLRVNTTSRISRIELLLHDDRERLRSENRPPAIVDPNGGPEEVWKVTHLDTYGIGFVMNIDHTPLRECGYVMWDRERLANLGLLKIPWQPPPLEPLSEMNERYQKIRRSYHRRTEIWLKGGTGWWSEHDESKVVYRHSRESEDERSARKPLWR